MFEFIDVTLSCNTLHVLKKCPTFSVGCGSSAEAVKDHFCSFSVFAFLSTPSLSSASAFAPSRGLVEDVDVGGCELPAFKAAAGSVAPDVNAA